MSGVSVFEIVSKKGEKCPFWSQPAISSKERPIQHIKAHLLYQNEVASSKIDQVKTISSWKTLKFSVFPT